MTRLGFVLAAILGLTSLMAPALVAAQDDVATVTGAGEAVFSGGATLSGLSLSGLTLGQGVSLARDGSATGQFQAVLLGTSLLGALQTSPWKERSVMGSSSGWV